MEWKGKDYIKEFSKGFRLTTNNRMELLAVIIALESLKIQPMEVVVFSDSKYVIDAFRKNGYLIGKKKLLKTKNSDLWKRYLNIHRKHHVVFNGLKVTMLILKTNGVII